MSWFRHKGPGRGSKVGTTQVAVFRDAYPHRFVKTTWSMTIASEMADLLIKSQSSNLLYIDPSLCLCGVHLEPCIGLIGDVDDDLAH